MRVEVCFETTDTIALATIQFAIVTSAGGSLDCSAALSVHQETPSRRGQAETFGVPLAGVDRLFVLTGYTVATFAQSKTLINAAYKASVKHIVLLGVFADWDCTDPHFAWHQLIESYVKASGMAWTHLHPNMFMETSTCSSMRRTTPSPPIGRELARAGPPPPTSPPSPQACFAKGREAPWKELLAERQGAYRCRHRGNPQRGRGTMEFVAPQNLTLRYRRRTRSRSSTPINATANHRGTAHAKCDTA